MRKIEEEIIKVMRECLDGTRPAGVYTLTKRDRVELTDSGVKYFLWHSNIFKVTKYIDRLVFEFSDNGYNTHTTHSRLKALVAGFIAPQNSGLCVRRGYICDSLGHKLYPLSAGMGNSLRLWRDKMEFNKPDVFTALDVDTWHRQEDKVEKN